jgi:hypothetical protein
MHEQISQDRRDYASNTLGNFEFEVTLGYRRLELPRLVKDGE